MAVSPTELPTRVFDILKCNYSSMPLMDFYGTVTTHSESAIDNWVRMNNAIDVADECLRRCGKSVEDPSAEIVVMFICHCSNPSLAVSYV